jgi:transcriptional regulator with XRE-family HTH domain
MDYVAFGRQIRRYRQKMNLTQEHLAEKADISASFLGHIERGSRKASLETLINIANSLNVGTDKLLFESLTVTYDVGDLNSLDANKRHVLQEVWRVLQNNVDSWN